MDNLEKRAILAVGLTLAILFLWTQFLAPPLEPPQPVPGQEPAAGALPGTPGPQAGTLALPPAGEAAPEAVIEAVAAAAEAQTVVGTDLFELTLTNRGGRAISWKLLGYADDSAEAVELVPPRAVEMDRLPLAVWVPGREDLTARADAGLYEVTTESVSEGGVSGERVRMRYAEADGFRVEKTLTLRRGSYFADMDIGVWQGAQRIPAWLYWGAGFGETASGAERKDSYYFASGRVVLDRAGKIKRIPKKKAEERELTGDLPLTWAGMDTTYFAVLVIPERPVGRAVLRPSEYRETGPDGAPGAVQPYLGVAVPPSAEPARYTLFVGPKDYELLRSYGTLKSVVDYDFGWFFGGSFFLVRWIAQGLYLGMNWINGFTGNYGLSIIVLTILLRFIFFPLMFQSQIKMRKMQQKTKKIQPKMKAIKERYRRQKADIKSRQKMNEEIMALYQKEGINPMGGLAGCLPLLIQMPFLLGFYNVLRVSIELRQAPFFGWIQDLSRLDPYYVTPILMGVSMLVQQKMTMSSIADPAQRRLMMFMPVMFTLFFLNLPSGLVLYWFFSNLLGIGQQYIVNKHADQVLAEEKQKPRKKKKQQKAQGEGAVSSS